MASHAKTEKEIYAQMHHHLDRHGGKIGATSPGWTEKKRTALRLLSDTAADRGDSLTDVLDFGLGDMSHVAQWEPFLKRDCYYYGIDGSGRIVREAAERFAEGDGREYHRMDASELVKTDIHVSAVVCLDVLYHIPSQELFDELCGWLASAADRYLLVSYATAFHQMGSPKQAGDPGFAWFPRQWKAPVGFELIARYENVGCNQPQQQALSLLRRLDG